MASIKRTAAGSWRARYRDEAGREHARHFDRRIDAQGWIDEVTAALVTGTYTDPRAGAITYASWFDSWSARQVWAGGTVLAARQAADSVTFADVRMRDLRPSHVQAWVKAMTARGLAASTVRTRYNYVHMSLRAAVVDRVIPTDPSDRVPLPRVRRAGAAMTIPTVEQVAAAVEEAPEHFRPFVAVCAYAGLRLGEAAGLQLGDVDFLRRTIAVRRQIQGTNRRNAAAVPPKYGSERVVFAPAALVDLLAEHLRTFGTTGAEQWLFGNGPDVWNRNSAGQQWRQIRTAVGLDEEITLHDLRHFYASGLIARGVTS